MALVYDFHLDTPTTVQDFMTMIAQFVQAPVETERNFANEIVYTTATKSGVLIAMVEESPEERADLDNMVVAETYGFQPALDLGFYYVGKTDLGTLTMVEIVNHVLTHEPGDAVLFAEQGLLLRRNGVLVLDANGGFWRPAKLARLTLPYTWGHVPSL